jgi:rod shape-determining protein MreD
MALFDQSPGIRPRPSLGRRLDVAARASFPATCTMLLMLLVSVPFGFAGQAALIPAVAMISVYFWTLYRPASMSPVVVFPIGLLLDLLGYLPIGVGVICLLAIHGFAMRWQRFLARQSFTLTWLTFCGFAACGVALTWAFASLLGFRLLPVSSAALQCAVAMALYPALAVLFIRAHRSIAAPEQA